MVCQKDEGEAVSTGRLGQTLQVRPSVGEGRVNVVGPPEEAVRPDRGVGEESTDSPENREGYEEEKEEEEATPFLGECHLFSPNRPSRASRLDERR